MKANDLITDALIGRPQEFELDGRFFRLYPETLGKSLLLSKIFSQLKLKDRLHPTVEAVMVCKQQKSVVADIIALSTADTKQEIFSPRKLKSRAEFIAEHMEVSDMATILIHIMSTTQADEMIKNLGLDKEAEERRRIAKITGNHSVTFGGRSIYGSLIDAACERYGWTLDYVLWGISLTNLRMMLADAVSSMYLSEEDRKKAHIQERDEDIVWVEKTDIDELRRLTEG